MATNLMVQADSALSTDVKLSSLAEEITRRLRNTSLEVDTSRKIEILKEVCIRMKTSGHQDSFIRQAVTKGIRDFQEKVRRSNLHPTHKQNLPLYQGVGWKRNERSKKKALQKRNWFMDNDEKKKDTGKEKNFGKGNKKKKSFLKAGRIAATTLVFLPNTKAGLLQRKLREREDKLSEITGFRMRFQEAGGSQLKNSFSTDLGNGNHCGRTPCPPCDINGEKRGNCRARNLIYEGKCLVCNPESSRGKDGIP